MLEAGRQRLDLQTIRDGGLFALLPPDDPRKMHRREQILLKRGQVRIWPDLTCDIERLLAAGRKGERRGAGQGRAPGCSGKRLSHERQLPRGGGRPWTRTSSCWTRGSYRPATTEY